jgi:hypothetical protein
MVLLIVEGRVRPLRGTPAPHRRPPEGLARAASRRARRRWGSSDVERGLMARRSIPAGALARRLPTGKRAVYTFSMRTLRVTVSDSEYDALRQVADTRDRSVEQLIHEVLASFQRESHTPRKPLRDLPLFPGHRLVGDLPSRAELYDEIFSPKEPGPRE